jgi:hypothetical protein
MAAAIVAALVPLPAAFVERWYSGTLYPIVQRGLTPASSVLPVALLDIAVVGLVAAAVAFVVRRWRAAGARRALAASVEGGLRSAAVLYLVFVCLWGFNYRRLPLEEKLDYEAARLTPAALVRFGEIAVERVNALHPSRQRGDTGGDGGAGLAAAFESAQRLLGAREGRTAFPAHPKRSMFTWYLVNAGIDGVMNPFFLEIILNPEILPMERPFSVAHEWAHLAGYADESEANFVAWVTCARADASGQYSGWLEALRYTMAALPRAARMPLQLQLIPAVEDDLRAINERLGRADPVVSGMARNVYDAYLKSQGVDEGIASYGAMLRLMVGTSFENGWVPRQRTTQP